MRSPHRSLLFGLVALAAFSPPRACADGPLTADEQALLAQLPDPDTTVELAKLAATVQEWKAKFDDAKKLINAYKAQVAEAEKAVTALKDQVNEAQATAMKTVDAVRAAKSFDPKALQSLLDIVLPLAKQADLAKKCPPLQAVVEAADKIEAKVKEIEAKVKADVEAKLADAKAQVAALKADADALKARGDQYKQDLDALANLDETQLRTMVEQTIRAKLQEELLAAVGAEALDKLKSFQNPAKFARSFLEGEFQSWIGKSVPLADGLTAKVLTKNPAGSLFDPKTELVVEIDYSAGLKVQARGLVLKYDGTKAPFVAAGIEKLEITADGRTLLTGLFQKGLTELGGALPDGFPVSVVPPNFDAIKPGKSFRLDVKADLSKIGLPVTLKGGLSISPSPAKVAPDGAFQIDAQLPAPFPIPGTPLSVFSIGGGFDAKTITAKAVIAPGATDKGLAFQLTLTTSFPAKAIGVEGELFVGGVGGQSLGIVKGTFGEVAPKKYGFDLTLTAPGKGPASEVLRKIANGSGRLTVTQDGLTATGDFTLYSVFTTKFDLELQSGGRGRFTGKWGGNLLGVSADAAVTAEFEPGFKNLVMTANLHVKINLAGELGDLFNSDLVSASVRVTGDGHVTGTAHGFGLTADFEMRLNGDLVAVLKEKFGKKAKQFAKAVTDFLAQCDPLAQGTFANQLGKDLDPFNRNGAAGRFVSGLKDVQDVFGKLNFDPEKIGGAVHLAADAVKEKASALFDDAAGGAGRRLKKLEGGGWTNPNNWINYRTPLPVDPLKRALLLSAVALAPGDAGDDADFVTKLGGAVVSLQYIDFVDAAAPSHTSTPAGRIARGSSVHVRVLAPTVGAVDKDTFLIGFSVQASGAAYTIKPGAAPDRITNSQMASGSIRLIRQPGGKWKGKINQPKVAWGKLSYQDASLRLSQEIEHRLEAIPGVEIDGLRNFYEKALVVRNDTKSDLTVQLRRLTFDKAWKWLPAAPPAPKSYELKLKAGERKTVTGRMIGLTSDEPAPAAAVRIWAEADDGEDWTDYRDKDLWLVPENPKRNNSRVYQGEKLDEATHAFKPKSGFRTYSERVVGFKNATEKSLRVHLSYQVSENGKTAWHTLPQFEVKAGETLQPRGPDGHFVRASAVRFAAVSEEFVYRENLDKPVWLVADAGSGVRLYKAEKVGSYLHTFHPAPATKPGGDK